METLSDKERWWTQGRGWRWAGVACVGAVWAAGLLWDWKVRLTRFYWHEQLIYRPEKVQLLAQPPPIFLTNDLPERRGGDLTRLVGIPAFTRRFEQARPAGCEIVDGAGFRNLPAPPDLAHPIVVVGDSFMAAGEPMTNMFAVRLAELSGLPVYNRAMPGVGPFLSLIRFMDSERFRSHPPKVLVWGFIEREAIRHGFSDMAYQLYIREKGIKPPEHYERSATSTRFVWQGLSPQKLQKSLPDTSVLAVYSYQVWNRLRYVLFGLITPDVFVSSGTVEGKPLLFLKRNIKLYEWDTPELNRKDVTDAIHYAESMLKRHEIYLVVVLIPDKETVYAEQVPTHRPPDPSAPLTDLNELEKTLRARGLLVVNLLPTFRARANRGELLYWPDDTHWNERGIRLAAAETWKVVAPLLHPYPNLPLNPEH